MTLHCTLVRSPDALQAAPPLELSITAPPGTSGAQIHARLVEGFGAGTVFIGGEDLCSMSLGRPPLVNGAVLVDSGSRPASQKRLRRPAPDPAAPIALAVHTGAGAGILVPLRRGTYTIGRSNTRIAVPDPELSREHARLVVTENDIMIIDLDSANGTYVDGGKVRHAVVTTASSIRCGNTAMSLIFMDQPDTTLADAGTSVKEPLTVAGRTESGNRGILLLTALLPLAIGFGLAVLTGMWMFLAFAAVSAVSVLVPLTSGRRQAREFAQRITAAAEQDRKRRQRAGPSLPVLVLAARNGQTATSPAEGDGRVWLRLGQARQAANLKIELGTAPRGNPPAEEAPVLLDPDHPNTTFRGPRRVAEAMVRSLVMQLAGYPCGRWTRVVICGPPESLPLPARFLPGVTLAASQAACLRALTDGFGSTYHHGVLLLTETPPIDDGGLREGAARLGWHVLHFCAADAAPGVPDVELAERQSCLREPGRTIAFIPDLAPEDVFSGFCRQLAAAPRPLHDRKHQIPTACALEELLPLSPADTAARWNASIRTHGLGVPLGLGATGPQNLDLQADGPHLLVAGTTGSGKSELLRSLVLALALSHPPDRVNFLFVDFKGGSGLGPLAGLVHCVGLLTDLSAHELERTLASLRAEIRFREEALAAAQVPDLAAYRSTPASRNVPLPHLVIVIDEFRMLVDDAPEVLRELMRIASIGRSLGLHLIMATQRPQGALTADIRANVTSSIALRVQSGMESHDIIRTAAAAGIRLDTPGRAYIARGMEEPQEFQAASTAGAFRSAALEAALEDVEVQLATEYLADGGESQAAAQTAAANPTPAEATAPLVAMVRHLWTAQEGAEPRRPVARALPPKLPRPARTASPGEMSTRQTAKDGTSQWTIDLGLMDVPDRQQVKPLPWDPAKDSHVAFIGGPVSGAAEALELAAREVASHTTESHCYFLDAGGTFLGLATHPRTGAHAGLHELRRAVRVLERLAQELAARLGRADCRVPLVVVISGWGSWVSAFRGGPLAWAEDLVQDLVRDGARAGITVLISGERELVTARFCGSLPNRIYFPTGSNEDSRIAWPKMPSTGAVKGRGVAFGSITGGRAAVCQLYEPASYSAGDDATSPADVTTAGTRPFRVEPLPSLVSVPEVRARAARMNDASATVQEAEAPRANREAPGAHRGTAAVRLPDLLLGVGGDELHPVTVRIPAGGVFAILGGAGSGKTNVLRTLQALNPDAGPWTCPDGGVDPEEFWKCSLARARAGELQRAAVLLADDIDLLPAGALRDLSELHALGHPVVLAANYSPLLLQRVPLVMDARAAGQGLLLAPRSASEGDLFGVRFDIEPSPPAGRAVLISRGRSSPLQVAWAGTR